MAVSGEKRALGPHEDSSPKRAKPSSSHEIIDLTSQPGSPAAGGVPGGEDVKWEEYDPVRWAQAGDEVDAPTENGCIDPRLLAWDPIEQAEGEETGDGPVDEVVSEPMFLTSVVPALPDLFLSLPLSSPQQPSSSPSIDKQVIVTMDETKKLFNFCALPDKAQDEVIYQLIVRTDQNHTPFFKPGILHHGPWATGNESVDVCQYPPIYVPLFFVNKTISIRSRTIFYGENTFDFFLPEAAKFFIKNIGTQNLSYLRNMVWRFRTGYIYVANPNERSGLEQCQEHQWSQVIATLRDTSPNYQQLTYLTIHFEGWEELTWARNLTGGEKEEVATRRHNLINLLKKNGGIKHVEVFCNTLFLKRKECYNLALLMQQPYKPAPPKKELGLAELMEKCRLDRLEEEKRQSTADRFGLMCRTSLKD